MVELLVVITIMGLLLTLSIPAYRSFNQDQTTSQAAGMVKDDIQLGLNKSGVGFNGHWFGIHFEAKSAASDLNFDRYTFLEITPKDSSGKTICPPVVFSLTVPPCRNPAYKQETVKKYPAGVILDQITLFDNEANPIDAPSFIDVRFNQSPGSGQIIIGSTTTQKQYLSKIARAELIYKNGVIQKSLVIDGGNICDLSQEAPSVCDNDLSGGPKPSRVFIVER